MRNTLLLFFLCLSCITPKPNQEQSDLSLDTYATHLDYVASKASEESYNQQFCILVDFSIHSGLYRMFVVDMDSMVVHKGLQGLVAHGSGCGQEDGVPSGFSNVPDSKCSSLGLSVIERRDYSGWGRNYKYWLTGLDSTNDRMMDRVVVLHGWEGIPDKEIYPTAIVQSEGCFTVSVDFLDKLDGFIKEQEGYGKVLMYAVK